jgi:UPF0755 protein
MNDNINTIEQINKNNKLKNIPLIVGAVVFSLYYLLSAPINSKDVTIHISSGQSINFVSSELKDKGVIRSEFTLKVFIELLKSGNGIVAGDYLITKNSPVFTVAWQVARGYHKVTQIKVTIIEGSTNEEIANLLADKLTGFHKDLFLSEANAKQGYLFPDTYFFFPQDTREEIVEKLSNNFKNKIKSISSSINSSGKSLSDIIIMASILEREASGKDDAGVISGILWKRISLGMPLQVDADMTTYKTKGLPEQPLNNPGLAFINTALNPVKSPYLYYLHDKNGKVHYAVTFEEHKRNIANYLK